MDRPIPHGRVGKPTYGDPTSLYAFVRRALGRTGGVIEIRDLAAAFESGPDLKGRLNSRGLKGLLTNMMHSGEVVFDGDMVRATSRALRRLKLHPEPEQ